MSALSIQPPFPIITGTDGQPLDSGYVWIGTANLPAVTNPITVYWDAALTIPAPQPIRTQAGYPSRAGTPARLYVNSDYSILVQDSKGSTVYSAPSATERYSDVVVQVDSSDVTFLQAGSGAVVRTAQSKLREIVSVKDFGAVGDGVTDDTAAITNAFNVVRSTGGVLFFPSGTYLYSILVLSSTGTNAPVILRGEGMFATTLKSNLTGVDGDYTIRIGSATSNSGLVGLDGMTIDGSLTSGEVGGIRIENNQRYSHYGDFCVTQFKYGRGIFLKSSFLCNYGKLFFTYCYQPFVTDTVLACTFESIEVELCGPVPAVAPPNWPSYGWTYSHSGIADTNPSVVYQNVGGFASRLMIEANLAKNNLKVFENASIGALYMESNYPWNGVGSEVAFTGKTPSVMSGIIYAGVSAPNPNPRYVFDMGDSIGASIKGMTVNNSLNDPTNTMYGVNLNTSDLADLEIYFYEYERGITQTSAYAQYLNFNKNRFTFNGTRWAAGMTEYELGRVLVGKYNAFDTATAVIERQEGTGGYPTRAKNFLFSNLVAGSGVLQINAPFGSDVACKIVSDGSINTASCAFGAGVLANKKYYFSTWVYNSTGSISIAPFVLDGASNNAMTIKTTSPYWQRAARVDTFVNAVSTGVTFGVTLNTLNSSCYFKGALLINIEQFDSDYGTTVSGYTIDDLNRIISSEVMSSFCSGLFFDDAPTSGIWAAGDVVWNTAPASGQPAGWMCTVAGAPGTWKAMANLA